MKRLIVGLFVGGCILVILLRWVDLHQLKESLCSVHVGFLIIGLGLKVIVMWIKSVRLAVAIRSVTSRPVRRAFSASMIGFAGNMLLPYRLGELGRVYVINKHNQIGRSMALYTLGITQLFDLLFLVGYFLVISVWVSNMLPTKYMIMCMFGVSILLTFVCLLIIQRKTQLLLKLLNPIRGMLPSSLEQRISSYVNLFFESLGIFSKRHIVNWVLMLTIVIWGIETISMYIMLSAFHIEATFLMAASLVIVRNMSFAFQITPGNVGIVQAVDVLLLSAFAVTKESALAYSIGAHSTTYLVVVSLGVIYFYRENIKLNLFRQAERVDNTVN